MATKTVKTHEWTSSLWGSTYVTEYISEKTDKKELTVYCRVNENLYEYHLRNGYEPDREWDEAEVNWNGYILGARTLRFDFEVEPDVEVTKGLIDELVVAEHENNDLFNYHVEKVIVPEEWRTADSQELWSLENKLHRRRGELNKELREVEREWNLLWSYAGNKFNWGDSL